MTAWLSAHLAPLMFVALALLLFSGMPVVFGLAGCGLGFMWLGVQLELMPPALIGALPLRVFGIMASELLLAIPFFTFMGLVLDRSGLAEDVLDTAGRLSGRMRGGVLTVHAASSAWAQELTFLAPEILARVQALGISVTELRFVVRPTVGVPAPNKVPVARAPKPPLPADLEARLAGVSDPELRKAIADAASEWLARPAVSAKARARGPRGAEGRNALKGPTSKPDPGASRRRP